MFVVCDWMICDWRRFGWYLFAWCGLLFNLVCRLDKLVGGVLFEWFGGVVFCQWLASVLPLLIALMVDWWFSGLRL